MALVTAPSLSSIAAELAWTQNRLYQVEIEARAAPVVGQLHEWTVSVLDAQGKPVTPQRLAFYGGMPGHGHGMSSEPQVTRQLAPGQYLVEGVSFNMHGGWEIVVGVTADAGSDKATFDLRIGPGRTDQPAETRASNLTPAEIELAQSLALSALRPAADTSNRLHGNADAAALGKALFFDPGLSRDGQIACASCHQPELAFTDGKKQSVGSQPTRRNAQTLVGIASADWFYWDGRRDSLWAQNLTPLETQGEMDSTRIGVLRHLTQTPRYVEQLADLAIALPELADLPPQAGPYGTSEDKLSWQRLPSARQEQINRAFANVGKVLASYVATLQPQAGRFDHLADSLTLDDPGQSPLEENELQGLKLFLDVGKTHCLRCHNGPMFSNFGFHNIGTGSASPTEQDLGWAVGRTASNYDPFNCRGRYSDAPADGCRHLRYTDSDEHSVGAFKVPTLRALTRTGPYMHDGRFDTLTEVIDYYREVGGEPAVPELPALNLSDAERDNLVAFLRTLSY
ncbi:MAG: cytochrome c peroxidase [Pseudomonadota bacterium]